MLAAESMEAATTSAGVRILPDVTFAELGRADTVAVPGVETDSHRRVRAVVAAVVRLAEGARRVASVCVGAHILAVSGNGLQTQGGSAAAPLAAAVAFSGAGMSGTMVVNTTAAIAAGDVVTGEVTHNISSQFWYATITGGAVTLLRIG
ncbi:DJ-1/PfpI family protein [Nocardia fluminea]|uniref:DJ-1/PfpI family protein n=1 Tax=Nocardia fluminea TaxID=134984 RepID=UPI0037156888